MEITVSPERYDSTSFKLTFNDFGIEAETYISKIDEIYVKIHDKTLCIHFTDMYLAPEDISKTLEYISKHKKEVLKAFGEMKEVSVNMEEEDLYSEDKFIRKIVRILKRKKKEAIIEKEADRLVDMIFSKEKHVNEISYSYIEYDGKKVLVRYNPYYYFDYEEEIIHDVVLIIDRKKILRVYEIYALTDASIKIIQSKYMKDLLSKNGISDKVIKEIEKVIKEAPVSDNIKEEFMKALNRRLEIEVAKTI